MTASSWHQLAAPFWQVFASPSRHWHPWIVHFPMAFLLLDAALVFAFRFLRRPQLAAWSGLCLKLSFWSLLAAALAGLHDSGLDAGDGNKIALGLADRWKNAFHFSSSITIHTWLAMLVVGITSLRLVWRWRSNGSLPGGISEAGFLLLTLLGVWCLLAAGYVGGAVSHD